MRVRLVRKENDQFLIMAEQQTMKGKKSTTGDTVARKDVRQATEKLVKQLRGENL